MSQDSKRFEDSYLPIGKVTKPHGLRGDVKIYSYSGQPENFRDYHKLALCDLKGKYAGTADITNVRVQAKNAIVKVTNIDNRNQAESIEGFEVFVLKDDLPKARPEEFYWHQYTGKRVIEHDGNLIGTVKTIFHSGAQDVLVVDTGSDEVMIPVTREIILQEDDKSLTVDLPPGLLDINIDAPLTEGTIIE